MTQPTEPDFEREESDRIMKIVRGEAPLSQYAIPELVIEDALKAAYQRGVADGEKGERERIDDLVERSSPPIPGDCHPPICDDEEHRNIRSGFYDAQNLILNKIRNPHKDEREGKS